ncbi:hypothetical protein, partial [[Clostridium] innocuum]|uniref:hypothetical protein n=1 Tax=Clostridium innocuum TaxID=1522 RepID=UPI0005D265C5
TCKKKKEDFNKQEKSVKKFASLQHQGFKCIHEKLGTLLFFGNLKITSSFHFKKFKINTKSTQKSNSKHQSGIK